MAPRFLSSRDRRVRRVMDTSSARAAAVATCLAAGYLAARGHAILGIAGVTAVIAAAAARRHLTYLLPAVCLLGANNGLPGINAQSLSGYGVGKFPDLFAAAALLLAISASGRLREHSAFQLFLTVWAWMFALYWCFTLVRTTGSGVPLTLAVSTGRDFLFFAVMTPLAHRLFRSRAAGVEFCYVVAVLTALYSLVAVLVAVHLLPVALANADHVTTSGAFTRVYSFMNFLQVLVFLMSLSAAVTTNGRLAVWASVVAAITGVDLLLLLTRAIYFGVAVALLAVLVIWLPTRSAGSTRARRKVVRGVAVATALVGAAVSIAPAAVSSPAIATLTTRVSSGVSDVSTAGSRTTNSVSYRRSVASRTLQYVGGKWPLGLGFQHPKQRYYSGLPAGGLRNPDVGILNQIATMGVIGAVLFFLPVAILLVFVVRPSRAPSGVDRSLDWFWMGATAGCVYILATILSLGLPNIQWDLLAAVVFGLAARFGQGAPSPPALEHPSSLVYAP